RTERRPGGGVNWWRMYRFPPITSTAAPQAPAPANSAQSASSPAAPSPGPSRESDSASQSTPDSSASETSTEISGGPLAPGLTATAAPSHPQPAPTPPNIVVPVILVGLQSISLMGRQPP